MHSKTSKSCFRRGWKRQVCICTRVAPTGTEQRSVDCNIPMKKENKFMWGEQGMLPGPHSISCAQKVPYRGNSWGIIRVFLWICMWLFWWDEIILAVVLNHCLPPGLFQGKNNAVDASQVFKTVIKRHHINISIVISNGTFFNCQYFINILCRSETVLGITATVHRMHFGNAVST